VQIRFPQSRNSITAKLGKLSTGSLNKFRVLRSCNACPAVIGGKLSIMMTSHSSLINRQVAGISHMIDGAVDGDMKYCGP
jgi:hypothetical protein